MGYSLGCNLINFLAHPSGGGKDLFFFFSEGKNLGETSEHYLEKTYPNKTIYSWPWLQKKTNKHLATLPETNITENIDPWVFSEIPNLETHHF